MTFQARLINNIVGAIQALVQDSIELHAARQATREKDVILELEGRIEGDKDLLRASLEQLANQTTWSNH